MGFTLTKISELKSDLSTLDLPIAVRYKLFSLSSASKGGWVAFGIRGESYQPANKDSQKKYLRFNQKQATAAEFRVGMATGA